MSDNATTTSVRRTLTGTVVTDTSNKTVRVRVERRVKHPLYGKVLRKRNFLLAHDVDDHFKVGDIVTIAESRRYSKRKAWTVIGLAEKSR